jgi:hypothetical protein
VLYNPERVRAEENRRGCDGNHNEARKGFECGFHCIRLAVSEVGMTLGKE